MKKRTFEVFTARGGACYCWYLFLGVFLAVIIMAMIGKGSDESLIKKQYTTLLHEKKYEQAYSLLSDRVKQEVGSLEKFEASNRNIDEQYEAYGIREELVKGSIKVDGNVVTFRTKTTVRGLQSTTRVLEGKVYLSVVKGKIDMVQLIAEPQTIEEFEGREA